MVSRGSEEEVGVSSDGGEEEEQDDQEDQEDQEDQDYHGSQKDHEYEDDQELTAVEDQLVRIVVTQRAKEVAWPPPQTLNRAGGPGAV